MKPIASLSGVTISAPNIANWWMCGGVPQCGLFGLDRHGYPQGAHGYSNFAGFSNSNEFVASFNRGYLFIEVQEKTDALQQTLRFVRPFKDHRASFTAFLANRWMN
jgi:hypothetical protein